MNSITASRKTLRRSADPVADPEEDAAVAPWLTVVADRVKTMRYGVVQIVVHDSRVVQVERTERTRFDVPQSTGSR